MVRKASKSFTKSLYKDLVKYKNLSDIARKYGVSRQAISKSVLRNNKLRGLWHVIKKEQQEYNKNNEELQLLRRRKQIFDKKRTNCKRDHKIFTLKFDDIDWPEYCPVFGLKLNYFSNVTADNSPSFDQIIPGEGYTTENIKIISNRANYLKNNATVEELFLILTYIELNAYKSRFWYYPGKFQTRMQKRLLVALDS